MRDLPQGLLPQAREGDPESAAQEALLQVRESHIPDLWQGRCHDSGEEFSIGLADHQFKALGLPKGEGVVRVEHLRRHHGWYACKAKIRDSSSTIALTPNSRDEIRITAKVAEALDCRIGDYIAFVEILAHNVPEPLDVTF